MDRGTLQFLLPKLGKGHEVNVVDPRAQAHWRYCRIALNEAEKVNTSLTLPTPGHDYVGGIGAAFYGMIA